MDERAAEEFREFMHGRWPSMVRRVPGHQRWRRHEQWMQPGLLAAGHQGAGSTSGPPGLIYGSASANVEHVVITLAAGGIIRVRAISVGEQEYFAFALGQGQHAVRWQAYDAARRLIGSGRVGGP